MSNFSAVFLINGQVLCVLGQHGRRMILRGKGQNSLMLAFSLNASPYLKGQMPGILRVKPPFLRGKGIQV